MHTGRKKEKKDVLIVFLGRFFYVANVTKTCHWVVVSWVQKLPEEMFRQRIAAKDKECIEKYTKSTSKNKQEGILPSDNPFPLFFQTLPLFI